MGTVGAAALREEGLYVRICVHLTSCRGVVRVWGCWDEGWALLGIPVPAEGGMRLERRLSIQSLPSGKPVRFWVDGSGRYRPWAGEIDGISIRHAAACLHGAGATIYLPFYPDQPVPLLPLFRLCSLETALGAPALALPVDMRGQPRIKPTGQ